ncbi:LysR family transcriptional regulator [Agarivorans sp. DSG3-1]|uniref:LysR family transcriptional regulator n=1 Tax=Agarivorans sp. DSG3-1 TaxID=3342249 RepID=UPI00398EDE68
MNLADFDLNLLKTLLVLLQEKNTRKAAERLGVSQAAVSRALAKIRGSFDDPLFVRQARGLKLTDKAVELEQQLPKVLGLLEATLQGDEFNPATLTGRFRLAINSYLSESHGLKIALAIMQDAPNIEFELYSYSPATESQLINQELDAGISFYPIEVSKELRQIPVAKAIVGGICNASHQLAGSTIKLNQLLDYPLAGMILPGYNNQFMQIQQLFTEGVKLQPKFRSQQLSNILKYTSQTNAVCVAPHTTMEGLAKDDYAFIHFEDPEQRLNLDISLNFSNNQHRSAKYLWLEKVVKSCFSSANSPQ